MKVYVTFGQAHSHLVNRVRFDKDCVAVIEAEDYAEGRAKAFESFGPKFCFCYSDNEFPFDSLFHYPRGLIYLEESYEQSQISDARTLSKEY